MNATDLDASREFGQASLIYSLEGSSQFRLNSRSGRSVDQSFTHLWWSVTQFSLRSTPTTEIIYMFLTPPPPCFRRNHHHGSAGPRTEVRVHLDCQSCWWRSWSTAEDRHRHGNKRTLSSIHPLRDPLNYLFRIYSVSSSSNCYLNKRFLHLGEHHHPWHQWQRPHVAGWALQRQRGGDESHKHWRYHRESPPFTG